MVVPPPVPFLKKNSEPSSAQACPEARMSSRGFPPFVGSNMRLPGWLSKLTQSPSGEYCGLTMSQLESALVRSSRSGVPSGETSSKLRWFSDPLTYRMA